MAKGKGKGSQFERDFSRDLSLWWSGGKRKDLFWRSAMSGGMSTVTGCEAQSGDIVAVDAEGFPLLDILCFELKCGYRSCQVNDLLDGLGKYPIITKFVDQARLAGLRGKSLTYALVVKRDRKRPLIFFDGGKLLSGTRFISIDRGSINANGVSLEYCRLEDFFKIPPHIFSKIMKKGAVSLTASEAIQLSKIISD